MSLLDSLKEKRSKLVKLKKEQEIRRMNCDTIQFYEDTSKIGGIGDGMVIIITPDNEYRDYAPSGTSHKKTCQAIFDSLDVKHINFSALEGDFGVAIPEEYDSIFIRMASILNGSTVIYYPEHCTEYQIRKLEEFNEDVKTFNSGVKEDMRISFEYNGKGNKEANDLDDVINNIKNNRSK